MIGLFFIDPLPSAIQLTITTNSVSISWNSSWDIYLIKEYSRSDDFIRNWTTSNRFIAPYNLSNTTEKVEISICPNISLNFTVGKTRIFHSGTVAPNMT